MIEPTPYPTKPDGSVDWSKVPSLVDTSDFAECRKAFNPDWEPEQGTKAMMQGEIVRLTKGYGFIEPFNGQSVSSEVFFLASALMPGTRFETLAVGDSMEFNVEEGDRGPRAVSVSRTSKTGAA